jgi:hypothetical protein
MRWLLAVTVGAAPLVALAQDNLAQFIPYPAPHPMCGFNDKMNEKVHTQLVQPFAICRTLAAGYSVEVAYPDPGTDALAKLILALSSTQSEWGQRYWSLGQPMLDCRPAGPDLFGGPPPGAQNVPPVCTAARVQTYLAQYDARPEVKEFRRMESAMRKLNLASSAAVVKLKQASAVVQAAGAAATFKDVAELLE